MVFLNSKSRLEKSYTFKENLLDYKYNYSFNKNKNLSPIVHKHLNFLILSLISQLMLWLRV